jgi:hypothetical protein
MPYRITTSGILETDTAEEALAFLTLCAKTGTPVLGAQLAAKPKRVYKRRQAPPAQPGEADTTVRTARPTLATEHGVKIGQVWRKRWDKNKNYRTIQISQLRADGIVPTVLKSGGTSSRKGGAKFMSYSHMAENYVLVKDV